MRFCTAINCIDGRVQLPVIAFLTDFFDADHVDVVTEPGPNRVLADAEDKAALRSIETRVRISVERHGSCGIAVVGHHDCAGNPADQDDQTAHTKAAVESVRRMFPGTRVIGLWVDQGWQVTRITD